MKEKMKVWLSPESHRKLKILAAQRGVAMCALVEAWIEEEAKREAENNKK